MIETSNPAPTLLPPASARLARVKSVSVVALPALIALQFALKTPDEGVDFRQFYAAALRLVRGSGNPYLVAFPQMGQQHPFVYPPLSAFIFIPFTALPLQTASLVFGLICFALLPVTLWLLDVRDWRILGLTLAWGPAIAAWGTGNETALLVLGLALLWRHRDRPVVAGLLTAAAISMKVFMWPLGLWLLATRRWRATGWGLFAGVLVNAVGWAIVGFNSIGPFLHDAGLDVSIYWRAGYGIAATLAPFGVSHGTGSLLTLLATVVLGVFVLHAGYVARNERRALTLTVVLVLVASPIVWDHYLLLLVVPMAIAAPRLNWMWLVPFLWWLRPHGAGANPWQRPSAWAIVAVITVALLTAASAVSRRSAGEAAWSRRRSVGL